MRGVAGEIGSLGSASGGEGFRLWKRGRPWHGRDVEFIAWGSPRYPAPLRMLVDPPVGLYLRGEAATWDDVCAMPRVTIVGTRTPTPYGLAAAAALAAAFADAGVAVTQRAGVRGRCPGA